MESGHTLLQITENIQRYDPTLLERAKGIDALMTETGRTVSQCASKLGLTNGTFSKFLSVLSPSEEMHKRIDAGELSASAAYQLSTLDDSELRDQLAEKVTSGKLTHDELASEIKALNGICRPGRRRNRPARITARLEDRRCVTVNAPTLTERWRRFRKDVDEFAETKPQSTTLAFKKHLVKIDKEFVALVRRMTKSHKSKNRPGSR